VAAIIAMTWAQGARVRQLIQAQSSRRTGGLWSRLAEPLARLLAISPGSVRSHRRKAARHRRQATPDTLGSQFGYFPKRQFYIDIIFEKGIMM